jgi:hypothetical protein
MTYVIKEKAQAAFDERGNFLGLCLDDPDAKPLRLGVPLRKTAAMRLFSGHVETAQASALVYSGPASGGYLDSMTIELEAHADGISIVLANTSTTQALTVAGAKVHMPADLAGRPYNGAAFVNLTFAGAAGIVIPAAASADSPRFVRSDTLKVSTVARTDGGTRPIVHVRVAYTAIGGDTTGTTPLSYWTRSGTRWTAPKRGGALYTFASAGGLASNVGGSYQDGASTIFGICYLARKPVLSVLDVGDSIGAGTTEGHTARGWFVEGALGASSERFPVEYGSIALPGKAIDVYKARLDSILALFKPGLIAWSAFTPNHAGGASLAESALQLMRQHTFAVSDYCQTNGVGLLLKNALPTTNAGNTASIYNAAGVLQMAAHNKVIEDSGVDVLDVSSLCREPASPDLWRAGFSPDGIHLSDAAGESALIPYVTKVLKRL